MKKNFKKMLVLFLAVMMLLPSALAISVSAEETKAQEAEATSSGVSFAANRTYTLPSSLKTAPLIDAFFLIRFPIIPPVASAFKIFSSSKEFFS